MPDIEKLKREGVHVGTRPYDDFDHCDFQFCWCWIDNPFSKSGKPEWWIDLTSMPWSERQ